MFNILAPITLITCIGFILGRMSIGLQSRTLSNLVILVATPALVFHTNVLLTVDPATISQLSVAAFASLIVAATLAFVGLRLVGGSVRSFLPSLMFPNSGNLGLPLVVLAFGALGTQMGVAYFIVIAMVQHSVGLSIASGTFRIQDLIRQPLLYSVVLVLFVLATGVEVPPVILITTGMLGDMMIPAMLILLGISLATLKVTDLLPSLALAVARLIIGIVTGLVVVYALGISGTAAGVVFIMATMPSAVVTYVYAERYQQNPNRVAGAVVVSTLLTFICLPALVWAAFQLSGNSFAASGAMSMMTVQ
ncbi:MAG: AEC family transporter [Rhizobiaceae bacterium]